VLAGTGDWRDPSALGTDVVGVVGIRVVLGASVVPAVPDSLVDGAGAGLFLCFLGLLVVVSGAVLLDALDALEALAELLALRALVSEVDPEPQADARTRMRAAAQAETRERRITFSLG